MKCTSYFILQLYIPCLSFRLFCSCFLLFVSSLLSILLILYSSLDLLRLDNNVIMMMITAIPPFHGTLSPNCPEGGAHES